VPQTTFADIFDGNDGGTLTVTGGSKSFSIAGRYLSDIEQGDLLNIAGLSIVINTIGEDLLSGEFYVPWPGADTATGDFTISKVGKGRFDTALTQSKAREVREFLNEAGIFFYVSGDAPDPGVGTNDQWAIKVNSGPLKVWFKVSGVWVYQGLFAGITFRDDWDVDTDYLIGDTVRRGGNVYYARQPNTGVDPLGVTDETIWANLIGSGNMFPLAIWDTDRPQTAEKIFRCKPPVDLTFPVALPKSRADSEVAATAAAVYHLYKVVADVATQFATITFALGSRVGVFSCPTETVIHDTEFLLVTAPDPRDATLSGVSIVIVAYR